MSRTRLYGAWIDMIQRCENPRNLWFSHYGARGISVCPRWRNSFAAFAQDMGERPKGMSLDREKNYRNYTSSNCRWATSHVQSVNRRSLKNTSGAAGVRFDARRGSFQAYIFFHREYVYLGTAKVFDAALRLRRSAERFFHAI